MFTTRFDNPAPHPVPTTRFDMPARKTLPPLPKPRDRRSERSRGLLLDALFTLMVERGYERLTTQNLIDRAGVGRATFYAHFDSKEELLVASVGRLRAWLEHERDARPGERLGFMLPFCQHLSSHRALYRMTFARDSEVSVERLIRAMLRELVRADLEAHRSRGQSAAALDLATQFVVATLWSVIVWWMERGAKSSAEEVHAVFQRLALPGLDLTLAGGSTAELRRVG
jgi:AcrR family transcriptional regulator